MKKVLAVDDSQAMLKMVQQTLQIGGYEVLVASDGKEALEKFRGAGVELLITDINMPVMDGITLIKEIRAADKEVPILTLTTESEEPMKQSGFAAGANGWIVKPFRPAQFLDIVR
ncbi:MAG TPA: response regulator, partial [Leptospiraceae bacterium]|nr:response regulator [Leptospiraceae bacterium]